MAFDALQRVPFRVGILVAVVLWVIGWLLPSIFPPGRGWFSLLGQLNALLQALAYFVMLGTAYFALRRRVESRTFDATVDLGTLSWEEFEGYLAEYWRRRGATVTHRGGARADGGVDLVLDDHPSGRRIVQAKHWKVRKVGVERVRALWGVREDERAQGAVYVTSGGFTRDAMRFALGKPLELIDGTNLQKLVAEVKRQASVVPAVASASEPCPQCQEGTLRRRVARRGRRAGSAFLGCSRYPVCTFTRDLADA